MKTKLFLLLFILAVLIGLCAFAEEGLILPSDTVDVELEIESGAADPDVGEASLELLDDTLLPESFDAYVPLEEASVTAAPAFSGEEPAVEVGREEEDTLYPLSIRYIGPTLTKPYDKTRNYQSSDGTWLLSEKLKTTSFSIEKNSDHPDVSLRTLALSKFGAADAGSYQLEARIYLTGADVIYYDLKQDDSDRYYYPEVVKIPAEITKRIVTITPKGTDQYPLSKVYGASDPVWFTSSVSGLLNLTQEEKEAGKKLYTGRLSRETGESAGKYRITIGTLDFGNDNYIVKLKKAYFTITRKSIKDTDMGLQVIDDQIYTGKPVEPRIVLRYGERKLKAGKSYEVTYKNNVGPGKATVVITGVGNYKGTRKTTFSILPKQPAIAQLTAGKASFILRWKKIQTVTGYQIQYARNKNFENAKTITVKDAGTLKKTVKGLKTGKRYYVRMRTYIKQSGKVYRSSWSKSKAVVVK
ncbi:MAG: fibronectin type III domain-containing protein [Clostridia bacterium]|nr:fibronectin type III domain-containing protein [Clostridia bacterium]